MYLCPNWSFSETTTRRRNSINNNVTKNHNCGEFCIRHFIIGEGPTTNSLTTLEHNSPNCARFNSIQFSPSVYPKCNNSVLLFLAHPPKPGIPSTHLYLTVPNNEKSLWDFLRTLRSLSHKSISPGSLKLGCVSVSSHIYHE